MNIEEEILYNWVLISAIVNNKRIMGEYSYNGTVVLFLISKSKEFISYQEIINKTKMLKSQLNRTINELKSKDLVLTRNSLTDKRKMEISLTKKGELVQKEIHEVSINFVNKIIDSIGINDVKELSRIFSKIIDNQDEFKEYFE